ncbi:hypothetical protein B0H10DRAFT_2216817 [Mycena sp. CBHHK59/15]|nr:hypothetical protein B0H10DRAFT_2216817 [Mycena sp. CBHHK59/15]
MNMINTFLDWAQVQQDGVSSSSYHDDDLPMMTTLFSVLLLCVVSNERLLAWVKNPVPVSQLDSVSALKCLTPQVDALQKVCNGIPQNENGLLLRCPFSDFPFYTWQVPDGQQVRFRLPTNCSTPFWDPIADKYLCTSNTCAFTDGERREPDGRRHRGRVESDGTAASASSSYVSFNGKAHALPTGLWAAVFVGIVGALLGTLGVVGHL